MNAQSAHRARQVPGSCGAPSRGSEKGKEREVLALAPREGDATRVPTRHTSKVKCCSGALRRGSWGKGVKEGTLNTGAGAGWQRGVGGLAGGGAAGWERVRGCWGG